MPTKLTKILEHVNVYISSTRDEEEAIRDVDGGHHDHNYIADDGRKRWRPKAV
jgi:hypothetical protein